MSQTWVQLFITRLLMGIGMGLKGATTPIFAAENSPAPIRYAIVDVCRDTPLILSIEVPW